MAFSHTSPTAEERDAFLESARAACEKYGTRLYPESDLLVTDLYPVSMCRGKHIIIFYGAEGDLKEYQDLKHSKGPGGVQAYQGEPAINWPIAWASCSPIPMMPSPE